MNKDKGEQSPDKEKKPGQTKLQIGETKPTPTPMAAAGGGTPDLGMAMKAGVDYVLIQDEDDYEKRMKLVGERVAVTVLCDADNKELNSEIDDSAKRWRSEAMFLVAKKTDKWARELANSVNISQSDLDLFYAMRDRCIIIAGIGYNRNFIRSKVHTADFRTTVNDVLRDITGIKK